MSKFYDTIIIITVFVFILYLIYTVKWIIKRRQTKLAMIRLREKDYADNREYNRSRIFSLLQKLRENRILWVEILSLKHPGRRLSLNCTSASGHVSLSFEGSHSDRDLEDEIRELVADKVFVERNKHTHILLPFNSKIVTDVVYFLFEEFFSRQNVYMLNFKY